MQWTETIGERGCVVAESTWEEMEKAAAEKRGGSCAGGAPAATCGADDVPMGEAREPPASWDEDAEAAM